MGLFYNNTHRLQFLYPIRRFGLTRLWRLQSGDDKFRKYMERDNIASLLKQPSADQISKTLYMNW